MLIETGAESLRTRLKNISVSSNRPFDEIIRYYAMERFLYRLSISSHARKFFLKGGLMLRVWDPLNHRATMDIDLLARTSNDHANLRKIIAKIATIDVENDGITFDCEKLALREIQVGGEYRGASANFLARLFRTKIPMQLDIGFSDIIIPSPQKICYPTLLEMPAPELLGYTLETIVAEKIESIVKLGLINTRVKDFYDLWTICSMDKLRRESLELAMEEVFSNRGTRLEYPIAFTKAYYESPESVRRWKNFLSGLGQKHLEFKDVIIDLSKFFGPTFAKFVK